MVSVVGAGFVWSTVHASPVVHRFRAIRCRYCVARTPPFQSSRVQLKSGGSLVIEQIFNIPGLGRHFVTAAFNRDRTFVMGTVVVYASLLIVLNFLADVAYAILDPRVRLE